MEALHSLWTEEQVRRFLWDGEVIPLGSTRKIVEDSQTLFDEHGFGIWAVRERGSDELLGFAGYWHFRIPPVLELLFGVAPGHRNCGIATQAGGRLIRYAFEDLRLRTVEASTDFGNAASIRVLDKLGMQLERREVVDGLDTVFYRLSRDDWGGAT